MIDLFNQLFGEYQPIIAQLSDGSEEVCINWGSIANYVFVGIVLFCVCKTIGTLIGSIGKGVAI